METMERVPHKLRKPCVVCNSEDGYYVDKNGQCVVYCNCGRYQQYNAPKTETGRAVRSVKTVHDAISVKLRNRIIERANGRCERCGADTLKQGVCIDVGHILSVEDGLKQDLPDSVINSDENLIAECRQCNLGHTKGTTTLPLRLMVAILRARGEVF